MKRKRIKKPERPMVLTLYITFWTAIFIMFVWLFFNQMDSYNELHSQLTALNANIAREQEEAARLEVQMYLLDTDAYLEELARRRGMVRPNEIVFNNIAD